MENALDAMEMAFAMFVFVLALTITFISFGAIKRVADSVLYINDDSSYIEYVLDSDYTLQRVVGINDIIPTLYSYSTELYKVTIILDNNKRFDFYNENEIFSYQYQRKNYIDNFVSGIRTRDENGYSNVIKYKRTEEEREEENWNYFYIEDDIIEIAAEYDRDNVEYITVSKDFSNYYLMKYSDRQFLEEYTDEEDVAMWQKENIKSDYWGIEEEEHVQNIAYTHIIYTLID